MVKIQSQAKAHKALKSRKQKWGPLKQVNQKWGPRFCTPCTLTKITTECV